MGAGHLEQSARFTQIIETVDQNVHRGLIPTDIYSNPEIYQAELENIFINNWIFIGHETEIPEPGDYCLRTIGEDKFVFVRDEHGTIRVLFDSCRHRGAQICRADKGNASHFRCPYHGWTYKNTGELVGAPSIRVIYKGLDRAEWGLLQAAKVESFHGLVFACLSEDAPSLSDYLGNMKWYLELFLALHRDGWEVVGDPQRWTVPCNWKIPAENFSGDDYHTVHLHKSMYDLGILPVPPDVNMFGKHVHAEPGHSISFGIKPHLEAPGPEFWGYPPDIVALFQQENLSKEQFEVARRTGVNVGTIFPNLSFLHVPLTGDPRNRPPATYLTLRQWQPRGPDAMEVWSWILVLKAAPEEYKKRAYQEGIATFGSAGLFEQDDTVPWPAIQRTSRSAFARKSEMLLNYQMGLDGMGDIHEDLDWPGPGIVYDTRYEEGVQRSFLRRWVDELKRV